MKNAAILILLGVVAALAQHNNNMKREYDWDRAEWAKTREELYDQLYPTGCCAPGDETGQSCTVPVYGDDC